MKLTSALVDKLALPPGKTDKIWFDDAVSGFGLRIRAVRKRNGGAISNQEPRRTWVFQYRRGGKSRRMNIGEASALKVQKARDIAADLHAKVTLGGDPAAEKAANIARSSDTFGALAEKYLYRQRSQLRSSTFRAQQRYLTKHAASLHRLPVDGIDRKTIAALLANVERDRGPVSCNRFRAALSAMFSWAMREGLATANPVANTNKREEKRRERILSTAELRLIWSTVPANAHGTIVKLLILTGQRLNEIAELRWSEIHFDRNVIALPGDRTKNHQPHEIPMSETVRALLEAQPRNGRESVFASVDRSRRKRALDNSIAKANGGQPIQTWCHHDLRRSAATHMAEIGILPHIIEAVLNHISGHKAGVAGIYNRAAYSAEKRDALDRWERHLSALTA